MEPPERQLELDGVVPRARIHGGEGFDARTVVTRSTNARSPTPKAQKERLERECQAVIDHLRNNRIRGLKPHFQAGGRGNKNADLYVYKCARHAVLKAIMEEGALFVHEVLSTYISTGISKVEGLRRYGEKAKGMEFLRDVPDFVTDSGRILEDVGTLSLIRAPARRLQSRSAGNQIVNTTFYISDIPTVPDDEIKVFLGPALQLAETALRSRTLDISKDQYQRLRATLGPDGRKLADFFATKMGVADDVGVSRRAQCQAERQVASVIRWCEGAAEQVTLRVALRGSKRREAAIRYGIRRDALKQRVWTNLRIAAARHAQRKTQQLDWLLPTLRAAVQDLGACSKDDHDSPIDAFILESGMDSFNWRNENAKDGGQLDALTRIVNAMAKEKGEKPISRSAVYSACSEADIFWGAVKNTRRAPNPDQHYAAWFVACMKFLACLFAGDSVFVAIDAKQLIKASTSDNTDRGVPWRGGSTVQLRDAPVTTVDHSANTTATLAKFSLFSMYALKLGPVEASRRLEGIDIEEFGKFLAGLVHMEPCEVPDTETDPLRRLQKLIGVEPYERASYANILGFVESTTPETGYRNMWSLIELVERYPEQFLAADGSGVAKNWFIETDGGHGPGELTTQFAAGILFTLLGLDCFVLFVNAGGCSVFNPAERLNGAASRRTNAWPLVCPHPSPESLDRDELEILLDEMNEKLCDRVDGATFREATNGKLRCEPGLLEGLGWVYRGQELYAFIKSDDKANFEADPMPGYAQPADVYRSVWDKLQDGLRGEGKEFSYTKYDMTWRREASTAFTTPLLAAIYDHCGGRFPHGAPGPVQKSKMLIERTWLTG